MMAEAGSQESHWCPERPGPRALHGVHGAHGVRGVHDDGHDHLLP